MMPRSAMTFSAFALPKPGSERMKVETLMRPTTGSSMRAIASAGESRPAFRSARTTARAARVSFALSKRCLALLGRELVEAHRITSFVGISCWIQPLPDCALPCGRPETP